MGTSTYPVVWVWEIRRAAVEGFKVKGFLLVEGDHFGKRSSVIPAENLTFSKRKSGKRKSKLRLKVSTVSTHWLPKLNLVRTETTTE